MTKIIDIDREIDRDIDELVDFKAEVWEQLDKIADMKDINVFCGLDMHDRETLEIYCVGT